MIAAFSKCLSKLLLPFLFVCISYNAYSQNTDTTKKLLHFSGNALITNNGISFIPTFSLGKAATIVSLSMGNKRLSFEPEFRFSMEAKPWAILLWGRYKITDNQQFKLNAGTHLGLSYSYPNVLINGIATDIIQLKRYWASDLVPNYAINKNWTLGLYYLYSHGLDIGTINNTHFLTLNTNISHIPINKMFYFNVKPQIYYLKMDSQDGYFTSATLSVLKKNNPFSVVAIFNKTINTNIVTKNFIWNLSLNYSFGHNYEKK